MAEWLKSQQNMREIQKSRVVGSKKILSDREIFNLALEHINRQIRDYPDKWKRVNPLGFDAEGMCDIEFPHLFLAMKWTSAHSAEPLVEVRDPITSITAPVVLTVDLGTYARRFKLYEF